MCLRLVRHAHASMDTQHTANAVPAATARAKSVSIFLNTTLKRAEQMNTPHMSPAETECLTRYVQKATRVFEWGAGGSTVFFESFPNIVSIESVESDVTFAQTLSVTRASIRLVDIGPTKDWGYPDNTDLQHLWPSYPNAFASRTSDPDLVLIDGRFRNACALAVVLSGLQPIVLVHDFHRAAYQSMLNWFSLVELKDSLAVLQVRADVAVDRAKEHFAEACKQTV